MNEDISKDLEQMTEEIGPTVAESDAEGGDASWGEEDKGEVLSTSTAPEGEQPVNIDLIMDLPLQVVVELGRTKMLINDLLQIGQGSVIELNKLVGEPLDILVNGKLVARGEVVVVREKFGVRITDILSTIERIKQLA